MKFLLLLMAVFLWSGCNQKKTSENTTPAVTEVVSGGTVGNGGDPLRFLFLLAKKEAERIARQANLYSLGFAQNDQLKRFIELYHDLLADDIGGTEYDWSPNDQKSCAFTYNKLRSPVHFSFEICWRQLGHLPFDQQLEAAERVVTHESVHHLENENGRPLVAWGNLDQVDLKSHRFADEVAQGLIPLQKGTPKEIWDQNTTVDVFLSSPYLPIVGGITADNWMLFEGSDIYGSAFLYRIMRTNQPTLGFASSRSSLELKIHLAPLTSDDFISGTLFWTASGETFREQGGGFVSERYLEDRRDHFSVAADLFLSRRFYQPDVFLEWKIVLKKKDGTSLTIDRQGETFKLQILNPFRAASINFYEEDSAPFAAPISSGKLFWGRTVTIQYDGTRFRKTVEPERFIRPKLRVKFLSQAGKLLFSGITYRREQQFQVFLRVPDQASRLLISPGAHTDYPSGEGAVEPKELEEPQTFEFPVTAPPESFPYNENSPTPEN